MLKHFILFSVIDCALQQLLAVCFWFVLKCGHIRVTVDVSTAAAAGVRRGALPWTGCPLGQEAQVSTTIFTISWMKTSLLCIIGKTSGVFY